MRKRKVLAAAAVLGMLAMPLQAAAMEACEVQELSEAVGRTYGICPEFLQAIAWQESSWQPDASAGGCEGLMQVAASWHSDRMVRLGVTDLYEPEGNMLVAADYLAELFERWEDPAMVLMVYNGDSRAQHYWETGEEISEYALQILEMSEQLEREHGK